MLSLTEFVFAGWRVVSPPDICWLDCEDPGILEREQGGNRIILCRRHAAELERGSFRGSYAGAPLPAGSLAVAWPWLPAGQAA